MVMCHAVSHYYTHTPTFYLLLAVTREKMERVVTAWFSRARQVVFYFLLNVCCSWCFITRHTQKSNIKMATNSSSRGKKACMLQLRWRKGCFKSVCCVSTRKGTWIIFLNILRALPWKVMYCPGFLSERQACFCCCRMMENVCVMVCKFYALGKYRYHHQGNATTERATAFQ